MQMSLSWEANSCSDTQGIPSIIWNPKAHYHVHRSPTLVSMLSQLNPILIPPSYFFKRICNIILHLLPGDFGSSFQNFVYTSHMCYVRCPSRCDHPENMWRGVQLWSFSYAVCPKLLLLDPTKVQIFLSALCSQTYAVHVLTKPQEKLQFYVFWSLRVWTADRKTKAFHLITSGILRI